LNEKELQIPEMKKYTT